MNKLQFELAQIIMNEIQASNIIDAYTLSISLSGSIEVRLDHKCSNDIVLTTCERYSSTRIHTIAYPKDWIRDQIGVLIKSLKIRIKKEETSND